MGSFIARRFLLTLLIVVIVSILIFLTMRILPGDPILLYLSEEQRVNLKPQDLDALRHELGLDQPVIVQYLSWMGGIIQGDFGKSAISHMQVSDLISKRLPVTMYLGSLAFVVSIIIGIPLGIISAIRRNKWEDYLATLFANFGITVPVFWLGILGIYFFGMYLRWLPTFGYTSPFTDFTLSIRQAIMPVVCLSIFAVASSARQTRSSLLEVIQQDYIRTAWSKGLTERSVILGHALKNSLIPVVTLKGISIRNIFGGSVLVETVFNIPGMGRLVVEAMMSKDFEVVQAVFLIIALVVCLANLLVDIIYGWLDPRIRVN